MVRFQAVVNEQHLRRSIELAAKQVQKKIKRADAEIEDMMIEIADLAKTHSMVATGEVQDKTQYFGKSSLLNGTKYVVGIERCKGNQELYTEDILPTTARGVHTTVEEHVKYKCSRAIVGDDPSPSDYRANPMAKRRSFFNAVRKITGLDLKVSSFGSGFRYVAAGMSGLSIVFDRVKSAILRG